MKVWKFCYERVELSFERVWELVFKKEGLEVRIGIGV